MRSGTRAGTLCCIRRCWGSRVRGLELHQGWEPGRKESKSLNRPRRSCEYRDEQGGEVDREGRIVTFLEPRSVSGCSGQKGRDDPGESWKLKWVMIDRLSDSFLGHGSIGKPLVAGEGQSGSASLRNSVQQISILPLRSCRCVSGPLRSFSRDRPVIGRGY
jgi:hypothetical protein